MDPVLFAVLVTALFLGHFVKGITGFGGAVVSIPILSFAFPPASAIAIVLICELVIGAYLSWTVRKDFIPGAVGLLVGSAVVGQIIGVQIQKQLDPDTVRLCIAVMVALLAIRLLTQKTTAAVAPHKPNAIVGLIAGATSGATGGLVGSSGPPAVFYTASYFEKEKGRAVLIIYLFVATITLLIGFFQQGMVEQDIISYSIVGVIVSLFAAYLGSKAVAYVSQTQFNRGVAALLLVVSGSLLAVFW